MIREAKPADIDAIYQIEIDNFDNPWSTDSFMVEFKKTEK